MAVPTQLSDLSATAASNSPAGGDTVGTTMDDYLRAIQSIIARISAGTDALATPALGAPTAAGRISANLGLTVAGGTFVSRGITDTATAVALTLSGSGANSVTIANSATNPTIGTSAGELILAPGAVEQVRIIKTASANQYITLTGGVSNGVVIGAAGTTDVNIYMVATGAGIIDLCTGNSGNNQVRVEHTASADRYITLTGSNGGNPTIGTSAGSLAISSNIVMAGTVGINTTQAPVAGGVVGAYMGTTSIGIYFGSGAPTVSAAQGSLYIRTDGGASTRLYSNNNGSTGWSAITSA